MNLSTPEASPLKATSVPSDKPEQVFIRYHVDAKGGVFFEYSYNADCQMLQDFVNDLPDSILITSTGVQDKYLSPEALADVGKHLWKEFGDVPTDEDGVDGAIDAPFLHFVKGTEVYVVWRWFEREFDTAIAELMGQVD